MYTSLLSLGKGDFHIRQLSLSKTPVLLPLWDSSLAHGIDKQRSTCFLIAFTVHFMSLN